MKESCACGVTNADGGGSAAQDRFRRMVERPGDEPRGRNLLFTVFSLAPMLLAAIAVAGLAFGREAAQGAVVAELGGLVGDQAAIAIEGMIASASTSARALSEQRLVSQPLSCSSRGPSSSYRTTSTLFGA